MKKILALILAIMMMATCAFAVAEEDEYEDEFYDIMSEEYQPVFDLYKQAFTEKWDADKLLENNLWPLLNILSEETAKNIMVDFFNMEGTPAASMVVYMKGLEEGDPADVLAIYTKKEDGTFVTNAIGGERSLLYLGQKDDALFVLNQGANSAFQSGLFFYHMIDSELVFLDGIVMDFEADAENPCFYVVEETWDVTDAAKLSNEDAQAIMNSYEKVEMGDPMTLLDM